jgi:hypothetical protein
MSIMKDEVWRFRRSHAHAIQSFDSRACADRRLRIETFDDDWKWKQIQLGRRG